MPNAPDACSRSLMPSSPSRPNVLRSRRLGVLSWVFLSIVACVEEGPTQKYARTTIIELRDNVVAFESPTFRIGGAEASGPTAFGRIAGAVIDARGRLWIADGQTSQIIRVGRDGRVTDLLGGRGEGPGEFLRVQILGWEGSNVVLYDQSQSRVTLIDEVSDREVVQRVSSMWEDRPKMGIVGLGPASENVFVPVQGLQIRGVVVDGMPNVPGWYEYGPTRVVVESATGASAVLLSEPLNVEDYFDGQRLLRHPLLTGAVPRVWGDTVVLVGTLGGDILVSALGGGEPEALNMSQIPGVELASDARRRIREFLDGLSDQRRPAFVPLKLLDEHGLPDRRPFFDRLILARNGVMWVRRTYDSGLGTRQWEVLTIGGTHLGTALFQSGEDVLAADETHVATVSRDAYDAAVVSAYEHPFRP